MSSMQFSITSLILGQSYDCDFCPNSGRTTLKDMKCHIKLILRMIWPKQHKTQKNGYVLFFWLKVQCYYYAHANHFISAYDIKKIVRYIIFACMIYHYWHFGCCNTGYPSKFITTSNLSTCCSSITPCPVVQSVWNSTNNMVVTKPCSV